MLTAAVIGCGRGGRLSLDALQASERYRVVAAADPSAAARSAVSADFPGLDLYENHADMLTAAPAEIVCISSPLPWHEAIAKDVLAFAPKGLLLEKPPAWPGGAAESLLCEMVERRLPVVVPHGLLVLPAARAIRDALRRGDLGPITSIDVQNSVDLLNGGIHWIVFLLDAFDQDVISLVDASFDSRHRSVNDGVRVENYGRTRLGTPSGTAFTLYSGQDAKPVSSVLPNDEQLGALFRINGSDAAIEFSAWSGSYRLVTSRTPQGELVNCGRGLGYHATFLDRLAGQVESGLVDYTSAGLSVSAASLIDRAYARHGDEDWVLGSWA